MQGVMPPASCPMPRVSTRLAVPDAALESSSCMPVSKDDYTVGFDAIPALARRPCRFPLYVCSTRTRGSSSSSAQPVVHSRRSAEILQTTWSVRPNPHVRLIALWEPDENALNPWKTLLLAVARAGGPRAGPSPPRACAAAVATFSFLALRLDQKLWLSSDGMPSREHHVVVTRSDSDGNDSDTTLISNQAGGVTCHDCSARNQRQQPRDWSVGAHETSVYVARVCAQAVRANCFWP